MPPRQSGAGLGQEKGPSVGYWMFNGVAMLGIFVVLAAVGSPACAVGIIGALISFHQALAKTSRLRYGADGTSEMIQTLRDVVHRPR